jgi:8-oxo-dGTP pyrophosphatase MutT (NUDIX family)
MAPELDETPESPLVGEAATVVLLREGRTRSGGRHGVEVLLLERPHSGSFAGAWAFPGGRVDPEDGEGEAALLRAAVRETVEETGLVLDPSALVPLSHWIPPLGAPKRLRTWFFLAGHPGGEVVLNPGEHVGAEWLAPEEALERHAAGGVVLVPPTWVTLHALRGAAGVAEALARFAGRGGFERYFSHPLRGDDGVRAILWAGDAQYEDPSAAGGARHRLWIDALPWRYERTGPEEI